MKPNSICGKLLLLALLSSGLAATAEARLPDYPGERQAAPEAISFADAAEPLESGPTPQDLPSLEFSPPPGNVVFPATPPDSLAVMFQ